MDWDFWKTFAALWGAGLSTVIALSNMIKVFPDSFFTPSKQLRHTLTLSVRNKGQSPLQIESINIITFKGNDVNYEPYAEKEGDNRRRLFIYGPKEHVIYLPENSDIQLEIKGIRRDTFALILIMWHRHSIFPRLPYFRLLTGKRAAQILGDHILPRR